MLPKKPQNSIELRNNAQLIVISMGYLRRVPHQKYWCEVVIYFCEKISLRHALMIFFFQIKNQNIPKLTVLCAICLYQRLLIPIPIDSQNFFGYWDLFATLLKGLALGMYNAYPNSHFFLSTVVFYGSHEILGSQDSAILLVNAVRENEMDLNGNQNVFSKIRL